MAIIVGAVIACAMLVALSGTVFADLKVCGLLREQRRTMPPEVRRRANRMMAVILPVTWGYLAFLFVVAPFGLRDTVIWFLIVPFLVLVPLWTVFVAVRAYHSGRHLAASEGDKASLPQ